MITVPVYNLLIVPGVKIFFQKDYFKELTGREVVEGDDITLIMLREEKKPGEYKKEDFYPIGVTGFVDSLDKDGNVGIKAKSRVDIKNMVIKDGDIYVETEVREMVYDINKEDLNKSFLAMREELLHYVQNSQMGLMARAYIMNWKSMDEMMVAISQYLALDSDGRYEIVAADEISKRTSLMEGAFYRTMELIKVGSEARDKQAKFNEKLYREDAIKKQIQILQKQLDDMHPENVSDISRFEAKIEASGMNDIAMQEAKKVLNRMKQEGQNSHEYGLLYDYLDFVTSLSWKKSKQGKLDLKRAEKILDEEHFGLKKVKNRIIQQIAVMSLNKKQSGSILLFVGPPGTGKTSIGQSIAKALDRKYVRVSLGGVRDEAEIRGHRRTYVGAMPGRIMEGIKRSGVSNPVVVLDEVDKLVKEYSGDPSSALLEVLDPEQNSTFTDHYMNVPYDLSDVLFVCTANSTDTIPEPLLNRMEVIKFNGYTETEKFEIAKRHLLPKSMESAGLKKRNLKITDKAIHKIISDYTMEAGVRGLKKRLDTLCRSVAVMLVRGDTEAVSVGPKRLRELLDQHPVRHNLVHKDNKPGIVTGLAWTNSGGDILFIEALFTKGSGNIIITGQLGDVMKESVQIAVSLVKAMYPDKSELFKENDLHIHVPEGAVPKDGPSAGITLTVALVSLVTGRVVSPYYAMTGEVSLRGNVMPIGGLPEKLMAAVRAGIKTVFIPCDNEEDLDEVPDEVKAQLDIIPVKKIKDVLKKVMD